MRRSNILAQGLQLLFSGKHGDTPMREQHTSHFLHSQDTDWNQKMGPRYKILGPSTMTQLFCKALYAKLPGMPNLQATCCMLLGIATAMAHYICIPQCQIIISKGSQRFWASSVLWLFSIVLYVLVTSPLIIKCFRCYFITEVSLLLWIVIKIFLKTETCQSGHDSHIETN